jgi:hypothetical protein
MENMRDEKNEKSNFAKMINYHDTNTIDTKA